MQLIQPLTEPISVYDLLEQIKQLGIEEPLRVNMGTILYRRNEYSRRTANNFLQQWPACGTIGCIAGWSTVLLSMRTQHLNHLSSVAEKLGLSDKQMAELFTPNNDLLRWHDQDAETGTPEYAEKVATHISLFQKQYEEQLKSTIVTPEDPTNEPESIFD